MSSYVFMKILESSPSRYDRGIKILTLGKLDQAYDRLISNVQKKQKILDVGCGTGALSLKAAAKEAEVTGIDINPQMLEIARARASERGLEKNINFLEIGIAELEDLKSESFDVVMSGLCFSELSEDELSFALRQIHRLLKKKGLLLLADEVRAHNLIKRFINALIRWPVACVTYLLTQTTTKAVPNFPEHILQSGFSILTKRFNIMESFLEITAQKV